MAKTTNKKQSYFKYILFLWLLFLGGLLFSVFWFWGIAHGMLGELPDFEEIENPDSFLATEVLTADGVMIGKYYSENRSNVTYEEIDGLIANTLMATEDVRFYNHAGIDLRALLRAVANLGSAGGASTISQQLAKNLFKTRAQEIKILEQSGVEYKGAFLENLADGTKLETIFQKFKEWVIAVRLEQHYTKEEILTMYLNTVEFSDNAFGIKSAARTYFNKYPQELNIEEAAVLIGMLQAPTRFNPRKNPIDSKKRRDIVLFQMNHYDFITKAEKDSLQALPLVIDFTVTDHIDGLAPYFRENLRLWLKNWANNNLKADGTKYDIYKDGLKIYTTLDSKMQTYAETAVSDHLADMQQKFFDHWDRSDDLDPWEYYDKYDKEPAYNSESDKVEERLVKNIMDADSTKVEEDVIAYVNTEREMNVWSYNGDIDTVMTPVDSVKYYRMFLQTGFLCIDPSTGYVKAWVGGANYEHFKYDHINLGTKRQVGSTFKPLIYALAIKEKGYSPCFRILNESITFEKEDPRWNLLKDWTPKNSDGSVGGMMTIKDCLSGSVNNCAAYLMHQLTPEAVIDLARQMGIESNVHPGPSICLGTPDISLIEMVRAYSTFANQGMSIEPIFVAKIEDRHGNILEEFYPEPKEALDKETAYIMTKLLQGVTGPGGTGNRIRFKYGIPYSLDVAGKTGTTQSHSDGWFMGYTPELLAGTWVGCEDRFVRFRSITNGQGASLALPIWANFMKQVYADSTLNYDINASFEKPIEKLSVEFDCSLFDDGSSNTSGPEYD